MRFACANLIPLPRSSNCSFFTDGACTTSMKVDPCELSILLIPPKLITELSRPPLASYPRPGPGYMRAARCIRLTAPIPIAVRLIGHSVKVRFSVGRKVLSALIFPVGTSFQSATFSSSCCKLHQNGSASGAATRITSPSSPADSTHQGDLVRDVVPRLRQSWWPLVRFGRALKDLSYRPLQ